jgi:hypothetical protein
MSLFTNCFAAANDEWERVAGELFTFEDGRHFTANTVEELTVEKRAMLGGVFVNAATRILISPAVRIASGIAKGAIITVRGVRVRVTSEPVDSDGDGMSWLACGSVQIKAPSL